MNKQALSKGLREGQGQSTGGGPSYKAMLASGSIVGAVLASSCCIVPLVLLTLGVSGAWISNLTLLAPYQPLFIVATSGFLGAGYWAVYRKPKAQCAGEGHCASPLSDRVVKLTLWVATALVMAAIGVGLWGSLFV